MTVGRYNLNAIESEIASIFADSLPMVASFAEIRGMCTPLNIWQYDWAVTIYTVDLDLWRCGWHDVMSRTIAKVMVMLIVRTDLEDVTEALPVV